MCHRGHQDMALMTITAFDLYLRPGEALSLVGRNIIAPVAVAGSQFKMVTVVVRDFEDGVPDKVGTYDNSLKLDNPNTAWIGTWLLRRARALNSQESHVFNFKMEDYRKEFVKVGQLLGVENLHPYQLRQWGSVSGLEQPFPRPSSCQDPRQVGHRPVSETLCKDRSCPTTVDQTESSAAELLHLVRKQHQKGVPRHDSGSDSALSGCPFPDVFTMKHRPRAFCLEIFAGTARVTTALRRLGIQTFPIDTCLFSSHDVLDRGWTFNCPFYSEWSS